MTVGLVVGTIFSFGITFALIPLLIRLSEKYQLYDDPDEGRKMHDGHVSYMGGTAIAATVYLVFGLMDYLFFPDNGYMAYFWLMILGTFLLGLGDDFFEVRARYKFVIQIILGSALVYGSGIQMPLVQIVPVFGFIPYADFIFTVILLSAIMNAFNLIDGIDGLCGSLSLLAAIGFAVLHYIDGNYQYMALALTLAGSLAAFLVFNKPKAKIFLGDSGSYLAGIIIAILAIDLIAKPNLTVLNLNSRLYLGYALVIVPFLDMTRVFFMRIIRFGSPFLPDRSHLHHQLLDLGLSVTQTLSVILALATTTLLAAILTAPYTSVVVFIVTSICIYIFMMLTIKKVLDDRRVREV